MATVTATFTLSRDNFAEISSLDYATSDGTAIAGVDYVAKSGRITMSAGTVEVQISIDVMTKPKGTPSKTFFLDLSNPSKYRKLITKIARTRAVCTIYTTDAGPLAVISISDAVITQV
ncbi:hypothetical protein Hena1_01620 [Erwinia phage Hena1]|uniref:Calx-beta domain-containing protein n=1 Tax=Erwinia phage Hena1 TaxID=2678601 RepID=A0A6B9JCF0_9CAUD|nr:hypothetical protein HWC84_gp202 [Erwinia phage Hena1]QGZ16312.1 hypothetical protein Hena1_01620 [Erwinia phage Hena1]